MASRQSTAATALLDPMEALLGSPINVVPSPPPPPPRAAQAPRAVRSVPATRAPSSATPALPAQPAARPVAARRVKFSTYLDPAVRDEVTDAANVLAGHPHNLTVAAIVEHAVLAEIERLRALHNHGRPFPSTGRRARPGRRVS